MFSPAQIELAGRVLARRRFLPFVQRVNPRYLAGWVHRDICRRLEKFSDDVIAGKSPRLMLLMPPRHGKSELASRMFPAWHLGRAPEHEFIACSYNVGLAMSFSRKVKEVFAEPGYQQVFTTRLNPDHQGAEEWSIAGTRGGYVAAGVGGGITGKGAHVLTIDDPFKNAEEADSADHREKVWDWYGSTAYTRLAPGGGVLVVQTWWHDDDLAGRLQMAMRADPEADQFVVIKYPAVAEADEWLDHATDLIRYIEHEPLINPAFKQAVMNSPFTTPPAGIPITNPASQSKLFPNTTITPQERALRAGLDLNNATFLREKGEALHPERYDTKKLHSIKKTLPSRFWSALYQQNPVPDDGAFFLKEQFKRRGPPKTSLCRPYVAFDFAISEKQHNDYTVGVVGLHDPDDNLHIVDMVRFKSGDGTFIAKAILNLCRRWYVPGMQLGVEDGQIWRAIASIVNKEMRDTRFVVPVIPLRPITDKKARASTLQARMQQGMVFYPDSAAWFDPCHLEMLRFPAGVHDDMVDAQAWLALMVAANAPPPMPKEQRLPSWKDRLSDFSSRGGYMAA
jgi:predicted phage terminase large subunit-like protein